MIIYLPLEDLEQRYTKMMNATIKPYVDKYLYPKIKDSGKIEKGQFLDINKTCIFKSAQMQMVAEMFHKNKIKDGDVFLVADIFYPGIEAIRYMADLQDIKIKIYGFNYAGRADGTDFVQKLGDWADSSEVAYHQICDKVFVGSEDHRENILDHFFLEDTDIVVTGLIWNLDYVKKIYKGGDKKEDFIIWPHRICKEKGFEDLLKFARLTNKKIVITSCGNPVKVKLPKNIEYKYNLTKKEYYKIMSRAKYYLSTAYQETFGYTVQEAIAYRCEILAPYRACYEEMLPDINVYLEIIEAIELMESGKSLLVPMRYTEKWNNNIEKIMRIIKK